MTFSSVILGQIRAKKVTLLWWDQGAMTGDAYFDDYKLTACVNYTLVFSQGLPIFHILHITILSTST